MSLQHTLNQAINSRGVTAEIYYDYGPEVTIKITGNAGYGAQAGWRIRGRASDGDNTYYVEGDQYTTSGSFEAIDGKTYMFQAVWGSVSDGVGFTVNFNSSGGDSGGNPTIYVYSFDENGKIWDSFPSSITVFNQGASVTMPTPIREPVTDSNDFIITGDSNGGGSNTTLIAKKTITANYTGSWNAQPDGSGIKVQFGQVYYIYTTMTWYAQQQVSTQTSYSNNDVQNLPIPNPPQGQLNTYTIQYNLNGGTMDHTNETVVLETKYNFDKWTIDQQGTTEATTITEEKTVYAQWIEDENSVGSLTLPFPSRKGYTFKGWSFTSDGQSLKPAGSTVNITGDTTFFAFWEKESFGNIYIHDGTSWKRVLL